MRMSTLLWLSGLVGSSDKALFSEDSRKYLANASSGRDYRPRDVVAALIKRLAHRNAQVQIYTLEV